jgi:thioesterase domain-containing protein
MARRDPDRLKHLASIVSAKLRPPVSRHDGRPGRPTFFFLDGGLRDARLGADLTVVGFDVGNIVPEKPSMPLLVEHFFQEVRKVQPQGPYLLGGFCFSAIVAYEVACKLVAAGFEVPLLVLVESDFPGKLDPRLLLLRQLLLAVRRPDVLLGRLSWPRRKPRKSTIEAALADNHRKHLRHAMRDYSPSFYPGRVTLISSDRSAHRFFHAAGWSSRVGGEIDVRIVSGKHHHFHDVSIIYNILINKIRLMNENRGDVSLNTTEQRAGGFTPAR